MTPVEKLLARQPALAERYATCPIVHEVVAMGIVARWEDARILAVAVMALGQQSDRLRDELVRSESTAVRTIAICCDECGKTTALVPDVGPL